MHKTRRVHDARRDLAGYGIVGEVQHGHTAQATDTHRNRAGDLVPDQVEDPERRKRRNALRNLAGDALPVGEDEVREAVELADFRRDGTGHVAGPTGFDQDGVLRLAAEVDVDDPASVGVAADAVPVEAAVVAGPSLENAQVRLGEGGLEGHESGTVGRRTGVDGRREDGEECEEEEDPHSHFSFFWLLLFLSHEY